MNTFAYSVIKIQKMENEFKKIGCFVQSAFDKLKKSGDTVDGISGCLLYTSDAADEL